MYNISAYEHLPISEWNFTKSDEICKYNCQKYSPYNHVYHKTQQKIPFLKHSLQHVFMVMSTIKLGTNEQLCRIKIGFVKRLFIKQMFLSGIELVKLLEHFSSGNLVIRMCLELFFIIFCQFDECF